MRLYHDIASASIMFAEVLHNNNQWRDGAQYSVAHFPGVSYRKNYF